MAGIKPDKAPVVPFGWGGENHVSDPDPYGDEPPRLVVAINDALTDVPDGAMWIDKLGYTFLHWLPPYDAGTIKTILQWVHDRLALPLTEAWATQAGPTKRWACTNDEEQWSRAFSELMLGVNYAGPGQAYFDSGSWDPYVFSRVQSKYKFREQKIVVEKGKAVTKGKQFVTSWDNPEPNPMGASAPADPWITNDDPAVSIVAACQQLTSYGAVTRGFNVEDDLNDGGYPASQASGMNIYKPDGAWYGTNTAPHTPAGNADLRTVKYAAKLSPGLEAGTIFTYNPAGDLTSDKLWLADYEYEFSQFLEPIIVDHLKATRAVAGGKSVYTNTARSAPAIDDMKLKSMQTSLEAVALAKKKNALGPQPKGSPPVTLSAEEKAECATKAQSYREPGKMSVKERGIPLTGAQRQGSHINLILRVHTGKERAQRFDSSNYYDLQGLRKQKKDLMFDAPGLGIFDSNTNSMIYEGDIFVGMGVPRKSSLPDLAAATKFIKNARPIGLARLAITIRPFAEEWQLRDPNKKKATFPKEPHELLFMSRLVRMYGDGADQNYTTARLLWSLRNTPSLGTIQVWWLIFFPRGKLAKCMWAQGSRAKTLDDYVKKYSPGGLTYEVDYRLSVAIANKGAWPTHDCGRSFVWARYKSKLVSGAGTELAVDGFALPKSIQEQVKKLKYNEQYDKLIPGGVPDVPDHFKRG